MRVGNHRHLPVVTLQLFTHQTRVVCLDAHRKQSDVIWGGKIALALESFQNKDSSLVLLLERTVNSELKFIQNCF